MEIKIQSIHFDATDKLEAFIEKNGLNEGSTAEIQGKIA